MDQDEPEDPLEPVEPEDPDEPLDPLEPEDPLEPLDPVELLLDPPSEPPRASMAPRASSPLGTAATAAARAAMERRAERRICIP